MTKCRAGFATGPRCLKLLCNCQFICEMATKLTRIAVEKVFLTRKLSTGVIAKVLQRDHQKIKRHVTTIVSRDIRNVFSHNYRMLNHT